MRDSVVPLVQGLVLIGLLFAPIVAFLFVKTRVVSPWRLAWAAALALVAGLLAHGAATTVGLVVPARTTRVAVPTAAAFPVIFGYALVMLGILTFRPAAASTVVSSAAGIGTAPSGMGEGAAVSRASARAREPRAPASRQVLKRVYWVLVGIYAAALLAWPLMSFGAIFAFDSPNANRTLAWYIAASIWLYPAYLMVGAVWGYHARHTHLLPVVLKTSVPLLSAIWFFLVPFVVVAAIDWVRQPSLTEVVRQREELQQRLDPIYEKRIPLVRGRDAAEDAREAIRRGDVAMLPHEPGTANYIGLIGPAPLEAEPNDRVIRNSEYLSTIVALLNDDPSHPVILQGNIRADYAMYWTPTYREYLDARREYMTEFNTVIARHLNGRE